MVYDHEIERCWSRQRQGSRVVLHARLRGSLSSGAPNAAAIFPAGAVGQQHGTGIGGGVIVADDIVPHPVLKAIESPGSEVRVSAKQTRGIRDRISSRIKC